MLDDQFTRIAALRKELATDPGMEHQWYLWQELHHHLATLSRVCGQRADACYIEYRREKAG